MASSAIDVRHVPRRLGSVPSDTDGERSFLQSRLALFGRAGAIVSLSFYVLVNALVQLGPRRDAWNWVRSPVNRWHLFTTAVLALVWLLTRGKQRARNNLELIDAFAIIGVGVGFAFMGASSFWRGDPTLPMVLAVTHAVGLRAVLVPSSAGRSAVVNALALAPAVASAYVIHRARVGGEGSWQVVYDTLYTAIWCGVALAISTLVSHVIYGLSAKVRASMRLGQYTLEQKIGEGGMGTVYRAHHALLRRPTAIKLLGPDRASERDLRRFEREVQLTSQLTHPNTIAIYDYGRTPDGVFYYAMEYLDGIDLETLVNLYGPQPPSRVIHILSQIASALSEAHAIGLIHRDVKPANVILCERGGIMDVAKVVDFGLVKALENRDASLTGIDAIAGTPQYMPPEAVRAPASVDARSDIYSLGGLGYFLLCGKPVFEAESVIAVIAEHLNTIPERPSKRLGKPVPADLENLILRCLEKNPDDRPQTAKFLAEALRRCQAAENWTEAHARTWWTEHRRAPRSVIHVPGQESASPVTVTVELRHRIHAA